MSQSQGAIQYVANRMNVIGNDDITAIKDIVVTKGNVNKAIQAHQAHLEKQTTAHNDNKNTIVTGGDIRKVMNREIGD